MRELEEEVRAEELIQQELRRDRRQKKKAAREAERLLQAELKRKAREERACKSKGDFTSNDGSLSEEQLESFSSYEDAVSQGSDVHKKNWVLKRLLLDLAPISQWGATTAEAGTGALDL